MSSAAEVIGAADCVYVASPPATHLPHARAVLSAGKALFCEKPLAVDVRGCRGLPWYRGLGSGCGELPLRILARRGDAGRLAGRTHTARRRQSRWTSRRGHAAGKHAAAGWLDRPEQGGFTREVLSHFLFLARRLFGPLLLEAANADFPETGRSERRVSAWLRAGAVAVCLRGGVEPRRRTTATASPWMAPSGCATGRWPNGWMAAPGGPDPAAPSAGPRPPARAASPAGRASPQ